MEESREENKEERKEEVYQEKKSDNVFISKCKSNPWMPATIVLAVVLVIMFGLNYSGGATGNVVSEDSAGQGLVEYLNTVADSEVSLVGVESEKGLYKVTIGYEGQEIPLYVTQDGGSYTSTLIPLSPPNVNPNANNQQAQTDIPKSDKPEVELFVWGYCPYGVQAQGPLAEVAFLLGDYADFVIVPYYDGHGPYETQQNKIQSCVQKLEPDKYWDYAAGFVTDIYPAVSQSRDIGADKAASVKLMNSLGINSGAVLACVDSQGEALIGEASKRASALGVTGSPTVVINGVKVNVGRTAEAYKTVVCEAFNNAPDECSTVLDSSAATTAGNC